MSLQVDLIRNDERRSGQIINTQSLARLGMLIGPILVVFVIGHQVVNAMMASSEARNLESRWEADEPKQQRSLKLGERLRYNEKTAEELETWRINRIAWNGQLESVMETAPATVQATVLLIALDAADRPSSPPERHFAMTIEGRTSGEQAMQFVEAFKRGLEAYPASTEVLDVVDVANYAADTENEAQEFDRVFRLECRYRGLPEKPQP
jgi:hypothetical protein